MKTAKEAEDVTTSSLWAEGPPLAHLGREAVFLREFTAPTLLEKPGPVLCGLNELTLDF